MIYKMKIADSVDEMVFDLLEVPIEDKDIEGTADNTTIDGNVFTDYLWLKKQFTQKWSLMCKDDYTKLRGFYTRQWENAEVPTYKLYVGNDIRETKSASGNPLQITNSTEYDAPILDFKLNGNTEQTTYTGKNRLVPRYSSNQTISSNGITCEYNASEQTMTFNGTCSLDNTVFYFSNTDMSFTANTTKASVYYLGGTVQTYCAARFYASDYNGVSFYIVDLSSSNPIISQTASSSFTMIANNSSIRFNNGSKANNFKIKIMVADTANTDYEPYTGNLPSPNPDYPQAVNVVTGEQVVKMEGKNLLKITEPSGSASTVTVTMNDDGTITLNGTATATAYKNIARDFEFGSFSVNTVGQEQKSQTVNGYTLSASITNGTLPNVGHNTSNGWWAIRVDNGSTFNNAVLKVQLEKDDHATSFEPYREQDYEVNLGKNLFDTSTATLVNKYANTNGSMASAPDWLGIDSYFEVQPNTTYTFSAKNQGARFLWNEYSAASEASFISPRHESTGTFTTGSSTHYIRFSTNNANATDLQIERSSTATTYAPYFTPIELCKIGTYQDYIWNDNGTWKVHKAVGKVVLDGTESWSDGGVANVQYITSIEDYAISDNIPTSDYFTGVSNVSGASGIGSLPSTNLVGFINRNNIYRFYIKSSIASTPSSLATWLSTHNTTVYYALATATDTAITESALITQLNAIVQASLPVGLNNVSNISIAPNLAGEMELSYELIHEKETIIRDTTPVRLTLTDGGVINPCECRQNVQITMRETTQ